MARPSADVRGGCSTAPRTLGVSGETAATCSDGARPRGLGMAWTCLCTAQSTSARGGREPRVDARDTRRRDGRRRDAAPLHRGGVRAHDGPHAAAHPAGVGLHRGQAAADPGADRARPGRAGPQGRARRAGLGRPPARTLAGDARELRRAAAPRAPAGRAGPGDGAVHDRRRVPPRRRARAAGPARVRRRRAPCRRRHARARPAAVGARPAGRRRHAAGRRALRGVGHRGAGRRTSRCCTAPR